MGLLTPPEMARKVGQVCTAAPSLAVFADADTGDSKAALMEIYSRYRYCPTPLA